MIDPSVVTSVIGDGLKGLPKKMRVLPSISLESSKEATANL